MSVPDLTHHSGNVRLLYAAGGSLFSLLEHRPSMCHLPCVFLRLLCMFLFQQQQQYLSYYGHNDDSNLKVGFLNQQQQLQ